MLSYDTPVSVNGQTPAASSTIPSAQKGVNGTVTNSTASGSSSAEKGHHIWLVTGPAGCGKSTIAKYLSSALHLPYIEGDEVR